MPLDLDAASDFRVNALTLAHLSNAAYSDDPESHASFKKTVFEKAKTFEHKKTGTFGFVTGNEKNVVVAFRGTENLRDWLTNIRIGMRKEGGVFVHDGFAAAVTAIWDKMIALLDGALDNGQSVWVAGHSLGGALANWSAFWLDGPRTPTSVHTFGQPRVGDARFAKKYKAPHFRFVNNKDIVPTVPLRQLPGNILPPAFYTHVKSLKFFDEAGNLIENHSGEELGAAPLLTEALGPLSDHEADAEAIIGDGIRDHRIGNYIRLLEGVQP